MFSFNIYVVGQGDQQKDKVGQKSPHPPSLGQESRLPPICLDVETALHIMYTITFSILLYVKYKSLNDMPLNLIVKWS